MTCGGLSRSSGLLFRLGSASPAGYAGQCPIEASQVKDVHARDFLSYLSFLVMRQWLEIAYSILSEFRYFLALDACFDVEWECYRQLVPGTAAFAI